VDAGVEKCLCSDLYSGEKCEIGNENNNYFNPPLETDYINDQFYFQLGPLCTDSYCKNSGTCYIDNAYSVARCNCTEHYVGDRCAIGNHHSIQ
jgi:hypothetical protein